MDQFSHISYVELLLVAGGFLTLQYLQIVLITKYGLSDSEKAESFGHGRYSYFGTRSRNNTLGSSRRKSFSHSPTGGLTKRRGRRTFGIKHL